MRAEVAEPSLIAIGGLARSIRNPHALAGNIDHSRFRIMHGFMLHRCREIRDDGSWRRRRFTVGTANRFWEEDSVFVVNLL